VYLSTYLSGYQLNEQGFEDSMGSVYFQGPRLVQSKVEDGRGEFCSAEVGAVNKYHFHFRIIKRMFTI
jgi:hypothetical protein